MVSSGKQRLQVGHSFIGNDDNLLQVQRGASIHPEKKSGFERWAELTERAATDVN